MRAKTREDILVAILSLKQGSSLPNIVFVSPDGCAGKTTAALRLASNWRARRRLRLLMPIPAFDAAYGKGSDLPNTLLTLADIGRDWIDEATANMHLVFDLEAASEKIVLLAVSQANLEPMPMRRGFAIRRLTGREPRPACSSIRRRRSGRVAL